MGSEPKWTVSSDFKHDYYGYTVKVIEQLHVGLTVVFHTDNDAEFTWNIRFDTCSPESVETRAFISKKSGYGFNAQYTHATKSISVYFKGEEIHRLCEHESTGVFMATSKELRVQDVLNGTFKDVIIAKCKNMKLEDLQIPALFIMLFVSFSVLRYVDGTRHENLRAILYPEVTERKVEASPAFGKVVQLNDGHRIFVGTPADSKFIGGLMAGNSEIKMGHDEADLLVGNSEIEIGQDDVDTFDDNPVYVGNSDLKPEMECNVGLWPANYLWISTTETPIIIWIIFIIQISFVAVALWVVFRMRHLLITNPKPKVKSDVL